MALRQLLITVALAVAITPQAHAAELSKRDARREALAFVAPFVDLLDVERTITPIMERPRDCRRMRRGRVRCQFKAYMHDGRQVQSWITVRRQRDGLFGFSTPLDVLGDGV